LDEEKCAMLLSAATAGSSQALAELYSEAERMVFAYALSIVRSKQLEIWLQLTDECIKSAVNRNSKHTIFI